MPPGGASVKPHEPVPLDVLLAMTAVAGTLGKVVARLPDPKRWTGQARLATLVKIGRP
jgi:hypothetical protein